MIFSREINDVTKWLKTYPNIQIVSRDGSITYNNAISLAHPKAIQISDRFHLLKNLTTYCKDYLTRLFKPQVVINKDIDTSTNLKFCVNENKNISQHEKALKSINMINCGYTKTKVCKIINMNIRTLNKILKLSEDDINYYGKNKLTLIQEERLKAKQELINKIREMKNNYCSVSKIDEHLNLDRRTVTKYLNPNTTGINGNLGVKRKIILDTYISCINEMIDLGATSTQILAKIRKQGYLGSPSTIRNYMSQKKNLLNYNHKNNCYNNAEHILIERKSLVKLLFNPIDKIKGLTPIILNKVYEKFPIYKEIIDIVSDFKILLKSKCPKNLDTWLDKASTLNIGEINSFINGIKRDIDSVKNAILYDYNNGLAEGSVNKLKVIKRIMYGRCSFALLRSKILNLEYIKFN